MTLRDTDLYDEDTDTIWSDASTYCKHGTYIGTPGGPDLMCGACEMSDPDPTLAELRAELARRCAELEEYEALWEHFHLRTPTGSEPDSQGVGHRHLEMVREGNVLLTTFQVVASKDISHIRLLRGVIANASRWATDEHDDNWMARQHRAELRGAA